MWVNSTELSLLTCMDWASALARLGVPAFRNGQKEAVEAVLSGRDVFVLLPTGGGKSLCYTLPALLRPGALTVVISPLRALMTDQLGSLARAGVSAKALTSDTKDGERSSLYSELTGTTPLATQLLFLAPEQLLVNERLVDMLAELAQRQQLSLVAVDEVHCVVDYGSTFRSAYSKLGTLRARLGPRVPFMALTASATPSMRQQVCQSLGLVNPLLIAGSFDRPNIAFEVRYCDLWPSDATKDADIVRTVKSGTAAGGCAIVYARSKVECVRLAGHLRSNGIAAEAYHSDLSAHAKVSAAAALRDESLKCVCCTVAFGMGIDLPHVRLVVHANPSMSMTAWYQEAGRAGRDGQSSRNVVYYSAREERTMLHLARQGIKPGDAASKHKALLQVAAVCALANACRVPSCRRRALLAHFGEQLPRGACATKCDVCANRRGAERGCYAMLLAMRGEMRELERLRSQDASDLDLTDCTFPLLHAEDMDFEDVDEAAAPAAQAQDSDSDGEGGEDAEAKRQAEATRRGAEVARRVAYEALSRGGGLDSTLDALEHAEEALPQAKAQRTGIAALLLNGRSQSNASAKPPQVAPRDALDAALRAQSTYKLQQAMGGDGAGATAAEAHAFTTSRGVMSRYKQLIQDTLLAAQRRTPGAGSGHSGGGPSGGARRQAAFVPPRPAAKRVCLTETDI